MTNYILSLLFICCSHTVVSQMNPKLFDQLDKEFRYKVLGSTLQDRGEHLFAKDLGNLINKSEVFKKNSLLSRYYYVEVDFTNKKAVIRIIDSEKLGDKKGELLRIFSALLPNFKPAVYNGKPIYKNYRLSFYLDNKSILKVDRIRFDKSRSTYYLNSNCFELYRNKGDNALFQSVEINAHYKGENAILISHLNKLFSSIQLSSSGKIDSLDTEFVVSKDGHFLLTPEYISKSKIESMVIDKLKLLSCNWEPGLMSGRSVYTYNKYRFYYTSYMNSAGKIFLKIHNLSKL